MRFVPLHLVKHLRDGRRIAAKVAARTANGVAWVWVGAYKQGSLFLTDKERESKPWVYQVQHFEAPKDLIDREYEVSDEELLHNECHRDIETLEEVDDLLERLVGDPSKFKLLDDYPDYFPF